MNTLNQIIEGCQKELPKHQELLFKKYSSILYGVCLRYIKDKDDAKDVLQEAFIKIFATIKNFRGEGSFEGWVKKITANTALYFLKNKKKKLFVHTTVDVIAEDTTEDEEKLDEDLDIELIMECMHKLPDGYRLILNLYLMEEFTHAEIAEKLGIKEATSRSQYFKARKNLLVMVTSKNQKMRS